MYYFQTVNSQARRNDHSWLLLTPGSKGVVLGAQFKDMIPYLRNGPGGLWPVFHAQVVVTIIVGTYRRLILFGTMKTFTSEFSGERYVFGGDKKARQDHEWNRRIGSRSNKGISIQSECPIGLIGDWLLKRLQKKSQQGNRANLSCLFVAEKVFRGVSSTIVRPSHCKWRDSGLGTGKPRWWRQLPHHTLMMFAVIGELQPSAVMPGLHVLLLEEKWACRVVAQWSGDGTIARKWKKPPR